MNLNNLDLKSQICKQNSDNEKITLENINIKRDNEKLMNSENLLKT